MPDFLKLQKYKLLLRSAPYYIAAGVTGLVAVAYAQSIEWANRVAVMLLESYPLTLLGLSPLLFLLSWWLVHRYAPCAGGSGIPQVMATLEINPDVEHSGYRRFLSFRIMAVKVASSFVCVLGGGAIGREGPMIHIATCIFHYFSSKFRKAISNNVHHAWIVAGGAAGIAAAFNTPLGGIVFGIEELTTPFFTRIKSVVIAAVIISGMVAQAILGPYLFLGLPKVGKVHASSLLVAVAIAILAGFAGMTFGKIIWFGVSRIRRLRIRFRAMIALGGGLVAAGMGLTFGHHAFGGGAELVRDFLFREGNVASPIMFAVRFFAPLVSYLTGCAGGIFAPSLAIGATLGSWLGSWLDPGSLNLMILIGMVAFLSGVTHAPFTSFVLVTEMTNKHGVIFPLMFASLIAVAIARLFEPKSFYKRQAAFLLGNDEDTSTSSQSKSEDIPVTQQHVTRT